MMVEEWKVVLDRQYEVSSRGRVRRWSTGRILSQSPGRGGYLKVSVCVHGEERTVAVHRLVAEGFLGSCPAAWVVNHLDGDKVNNAASNLEYTTAKGNAQHAARLGLAPSGSRHGRATKPECTARGERVNTAVLSAQQVRELREARAAGETLKALAARFGISKSATHSIVTRKNWRHV